MTNYPPEPWDLRGRLTASAFLVPLDEVPIDLPPGWQPVRLGRRAVIGACWVSYEPGGVLSYSELMATVLLRRGLRIVPTVIAIWVDSETSRDGGRALWGIPKELADFDVVGTSWSAREDKGAIASATIRPRRLLPGRLPVGFSIVQNKNGDALVSPVRARARLTSARVDWDADRAGPLAFLTGRSPLMSFTLHDFRMRFGRAGR